MADDKHGKTLFIRNLPYTCTNSQLEEVFSNVGPLKSCFVVSDKDSGKCRGFGYVKFSILEDAKHALENVKKINDRPVHIQYANKKEKKKRFGASKASFEGEDKDNQTLNESGKADLQERLSAIATKELNQSSDEKKKRFKKATPPVAPVKGQQQAPNPRNEGKRARLIVRNLSFKCTPKDMKKIFSEHGTVEDVHIPEKGGGIKLGFGFVQFTTKSQAGMALSALNGKDIKGRTVAIDWALPKDKFEIIMKDKREAEESMEVDPEPQQATEVVPIKETQVKESSSDRDQAESDSSSEEEEEGDESSSEDEEQESEGEKENETEKKVKERESDVNQGRTVFIRNLPFNISEENVQEFFSQFGAVNYARLVMDHKTGIPKGSAFVQFSSKDSADTCVNKAGGSGEGESGIEIGGRTLHVTVAVTREQAGELAQKKDKEKEQKDTRNLYLAREGMIRPGTEASKDVPQIDLSKRMKNDAAKRKKLRDQNVFVSSVRLCIHNLPATLGDGELRKVVLKASGDKKAKLTECRIMRDLNRVNSDGKGKSRGYAFCAFSQHEHALAALRHLNNNSSIFGDNKRPIVEFSLENRKALEAKQKRLEKSQLKLNQKSWRPGVGSSTKPNNSAVKGDEASKSKKGRQMWKKNKDSKPLDTRKAQDKVARSLHQGPLGLPSHSGAKQRHKPRPNEGRTRPMTRGFNMVRQQNSNKSRQKKDAPGKFKNPHKRKNITDSFDKLVASYKSKIMKSAKL